MVMLLFVKLQDSSEQYTTEKLEAAADELSSIPMTVDEVTFGGDIAAITSAMKEAVSQVEEHVHDVVPQSGLGLAHAVNDVSSLIRFRHHCE